MTDLVKRWKRAGERAAEEHVRVLMVAGEYRATSSSRPLASYRLNRTPDGWACECPANAEFGMPCKHLWVLGGLLNLDVLSDMRLNWAEFAGEDRAAA